MFVAGPEFVSRESGICRRQVGPAFWMHRGQMVGFNAVMSQHQRMKLKATGKAARTVEMGRFIVADPKVWIDKIRRRFRPTPGF